MINIIHYSFVPNTASTNRLLSYLNHIPEGEHVRVYFICPDNKRSKIQDSLSGVKIIYCWEVLGKISRISNLLTYLLSLIYIYINIRKNDIIYAYNVPKFLKLFRKKSIHCYSERTEFPEIDNYTSRLLSCNIKEHLKLCRSLEGLFVISEPLKDYYISNGVKPSCIHLLNMTVDERRFTKIEKQESEKYVAYCGNASNNKDGVDKLIRSFSIVSKDYPDLKLYIIGKAPQSKTECSNRKLVEDLKLSSHVVFTGELPAVDVVKVLMGAEVLLLNRPNNLQAKYGFPTKLGEYLMTGNPTVVTSVGDIPKFLENEKSAMVANPDNDEDFANKLLWLLDHPQEAKAIGSRGKLVALENFSAKKETKKLFSIIKCCN